MMQKLKLTGRSRRMQHFQELNSKSELNLVSMMDIFTILVFFLLVSSSSQQLQASKDIKLPTSIAKKVPHETLIISVTKEDLLVQGRLVAKLSDVLASGDGGYAPLEKELNYQSSLRVLSNAPKDAPRAVTIMGDETIPYQLLRKILTSCRDTNYTQIAFAAYQKAKGKT
jgi:biopolymer transport protein ExbD